MKKGCLLDFWRGGGFRAINTDLAISQLLLGASPPPILFDLYFAEKDIGFFQSPELAREQMSRLTRHPAFARRAGSLALLAPMYVCGMAWGLNPLLDPGPARALTANANPWIRASGLFNPQNSSGDATLSAARPSPLGHRRALASTNLAPDEFDRVLTRGLPDEVFEFLMLDHPAGNGKLCPPIDWANPSREAIEYCGNQTYLGALWRQWNPLLILPWLVDNLAEIEDPGFLTAHVLLGAQPEILAPGHALDIGLLRRLRGEYPALAAAPA